MDYIATFLEGVITFVSPCLLPMLPLYLAYFAGDANESVAREGANGRHLLRTVGHACGFVLGFTLVFVLLGVAAGALGGLLVEYSAIVNVACGLVVVFFGLHYAGVFESKLLNRTLKPGAAGRKPHSFASSVAFGFVFAIGWTPCVGVFLGSALALAATSSSALHGMALLLCYSAGLAIPLLASAIAIDQLAGAFNAIKRNYRTINRVCGIMLVVMGALMATGVLESLLRALTTL